ncbi:MAG: DHH family phosphoesterase [Phycisphaeraceae bacterium]|nr:DHH family phosphoesterase [Phycisphaeraceae bacterium]
MTDARAETHPWTANTDAAGAARWLADKAFVVVTTHTKPDGDAVGSTIALARALRSRGVRVEVWYLGALPLWLSEVVGDTPVRSIERDGLPADADPDGIVLLDTGSWSQLDGLREWLAARAERTLVIDHHLQGNGDIASLRLLDTGAAAACQPVAQVCCDLLALPSASRLPAELATPLYLGLATDTGWFRYSNVRPPVMRLAADLIEAGADHVELFRIVEQQDEPGRFRLLAAALSSLEFHSNDRIALMSLKMEDFHRTKADATDSGGFADKVLAVRTVVVAGVLTEVSDGTQGKPPLTKISLRSKDGHGAIDVNEIARSLGGGGHARAAGARVSAPLGDARSRLLDALTQALG